MHPSSDFHRVPRWPPPALQTAVPRHAPPWPPAAGSEGRAMTGTRSGGCEGGRALARQQRPLPSSRAPATAACLHSVPQIPSQRPPLLTRYAGKTGWPQGFCVALSVTSEKRLSHTPGDIPGMFSGRPSTPGMDRGESCPEPGQVSCSVPSSGVVGLWTNCPSDFLFCTRRWGHLWRRKVIRALGTGDRVSWRQQGL